MCGGPGECMHTCVKVCSHLWSVEDRRACQVSCLSLPILFSLSQGSLLESRTKLVASKHSFHPVSAPTPTTYTQCWGDRAASDHTWLFIWVLGIWTWFFTATATPLIYWPSLQPQIFICKLGPCLLFVFHWQHRKELLTFWLLPELWTSFLQLYFFSFTGFLTGVYSYT